MDYIVKKALKKIAIQKDRVDYDQLCVELKAEFVYQDFDPQVIKRKLKDLHNVKF